MKKICFSLFFSIIFLLFTPNKTIFAQIVINEVLNNPAGDEAGAEWVELFNKEDTQASLAGCVLALDDSAQSQKVTFDAEDFVDKYKVVSWDSAWLRNSGDLVSLTCPGLIDSVSYGDQEGSTVESPNEGYSFGRNPNGTGIFVVLSSVTLQSANSETHVATPTVSPTLALSHTPKPSLTPKPTNTSKSTVTISPVPTVRIQISNTPKVTNGEISQPSTNLVELVSTRQPNESEEVLPQTKPEVLGSSEKRLPIFAIAVTALGLLIASVSLYPIIRTLQKRYNLKDEKDSG